MWTNTVNSHKSDPRKVWQTIDNTLGPGHTATDDSVYATEFIDFFIKKVADVRTSSVGADDPEYSFTTHWLSTFSSVTSADDPMPTWLLKQCSDTIVTFIINLVNRSQEQNVQQCSNLP
jgi:hypothetical protein